MNSPKLIGQTTNSAKIENKKLAMGFYRHTEGTLPTFFFEFKLLPRLSFEFQTGYTRFENNKFPISPSQNVSQTKFAIGIDGRFYVLKSKRHPLEGGFVSATTSFFHRSSFAEFAKYEPVQTSHSKTGIGIGGNYYFYNQLSIGATTHLNYVSATDLYLSEKGATRRIQNRTGFILTYSFQLGFSF